MANIASVDHGSANYGTIESRALRAGIRQGTIQGPSPFFDQAVEQIYEYERAAEARGENLSHGTTDIRGAGSSIS